MGTMYHHVAVAVVGDYAQAEADAAFEAVKERARELSASDVPWQPDLESLLVGPVHSIANSYSTYAMLPDGSKEGWGTSNLCDELRDYFTQTMGPFAYGEAFVGSWGEGPSKGRTV